MTEINTCINDRNCRAGSTRVDVPSEVRLDLKQVILGSNRWVVWCESSVYEIVEFRALNIETGEEARRA